MELPGVYPVGYDHQHFPPKCSRHEADDPSIEPSRDLVTLHSIGHRRSRPYPGLSTNFDMYEGWEQEDSGGDLDHDVYEHFRRDITDGSSVHKGAIWVSANRATSLTDAYTAYGNEVGPLPTT